MKALGMTNVMEIPRIKKVVVNIGLGEAMDNPKALDAAVIDLTTITGQKPVITKARKSIANFKVARRTCHWYRSNFTRRTYVGIP